MIYYSTLDQNETSPLIFIVHSVLLSLWLQKIVRTRICGGERIGSICKLKVAVYLTCQATVNAERLS